jgi:Xaa-Pro dipeptidase
MKLKRFQQFLRKKNIDIAWFTSPDPTIVYFTGFHFDPAFLLVTKRGASLFISKLDQHPHLSGISIRNLVKGWQKRLGSPHIQKIGMNKECMTLAFQEKLKKIFPKARFVDVSQELWNLRKEKTAAEVKKIARACAITDKTLTSLVKNFKRQELKTELDVALYLEQEIKKQGGGIAFPTIVAMGKNAAIPHHQTSLAKLKRGFLLLDFGASYQNYCADMSRMLFLGKPTKQEQQMYDLLQEAQQAAVMAVHADVRLETLDTVAKKKLGKYANQFIHSLGHGIGVEVHEPPRLSLGSKDKMESGMVFTIEPGVYFPGKYGLRIEDTLAFDKKVKVLTKSTKKLVRI